MRHVGIALLLCAAIAGAVMAWKPAPTVCERTLHYRIGTVDQRFGISTRAFQEAIEDAEYLWETATKHNLFEHRANADFAINLVFDERQQATIEGNRLSRQLEQTEASSNQVKSMHQRWQDIYRERSEAYEQDLAAYQDRITDHNDQVVHWNQQGGAPRSIYDTLEAEQDTLDQAKAALRAQRVELEDTISTLQSLEEESKTLVSNYNQRAQTYNTLHGVGSPFHKGEYNGRDITIYQFHDSGDLTLVLAHELGHALHLKHVADSNAIMYELMGSQDPDNPELQPDDLKALDAVCHAAR